MVCARLCLAWFSGTYVHLRQAKRVRGSGAKPQFRKGPCGQVGASPVLYQDLSRIVHGDAGEPTGRELRSGLVCRPGGGYPAGQVASHSAVPGQGPEGPFMRPRHPRSLPPWLHRLMQSKAFQQRLRQGDREAVALVEAAWRFVHFSSDHEDR